MEVDTQGRREGRNQQWGIWFDLPCAHWLLASTHGETPSPYDIPLSTNTLHNPVPPLARNIETFKPGLLLSQTPTKFTGE